MPRKKRGHGFYRVKAGRHQSGGGRGGSRGGERSGPTNSSAEESQLREESRSSSVMSVDSASVVSADSVETNFTDVFSHALSPVGEPVYGREDGCGINAFDIVKQETCSLIRSLLPNHWAVMEATDGFHVVLLSRSADIAIQRNLFFSCSGTVRITVHRKPIPCTLHDSIVKGIECMPLTEQSYRLFVDRVLRIVQLVRSYEVCAGADEEKFQNLWQSDSSGCIDRNPYDESRYISTFRSDNCSLLVDIKNWRCIQCTKAHRRLRDRFLSHQSEESNPHTRNDLLDESQLQRKLKNLKADKNKLKKAVDYLHRKVRALIDTEGVHVDSDIGEHLTEILRDSTLTATQQIFIQQQHKAASCKGPSGMRWHPAMIRFALLLKTTSSAAYTAMQSSGFIKLPSERTLYDYSHAMPEQEGVFHERINVIGDTIAKFTEEHKQFHCLLLDEIHISQKLVYNKSDGNLVGYVKLDEARAELQCLSDNLESNTTGTATQPVVATKILAFMVKGATNSVKEIVGAYPTSSLSKEQLFDYVWDVITACEKCGIKIFAIVCDGSSINRSFFAMHPPATQHERGIVFDTVNLCAPDRKIFFISDPPHLLKTIRNCFAKSGMGKRCTRLLTKGAEHIVWKTIERLYLEDLKLTLRRCYKLSSQNVYLNSYSCMKVSYAAQVMSKSVGLDLQDRDWNGTKETVTFILRTNDFFDNLNGAHTSQASKTANPRLAPYTCTDDERFTELKGYEQYIMDWETEVNSLPISATEKSKHLLSKQTMEGIYITVNGFIGAVLFLLCDAKAKFVNARALCQDPLEQYFSKQRAAGGGRQNPTVTSFLATDQRIAIHRDLNVKRRSGNVEGSQCGMSISDESLPKLKRSKKSDCEGIQETV